MTSLYASLQHVTNDGIDSIAFREYFGSKMPTALCEQFLQDLQATHRKFFVIDTNATLAINDGKTYENNGSKLFILLNMLSFLIHLLLGGTAHFTGTRWHELGHSMLQHCEYETIGGVVK